GGIINCWPTRNALPGAALLASWSCFTAIPYRFATLARVSALYRMGFPADPLTFRQLGNRGIEFFGITLGQDEFEFGIVRRRCRPEHVGIEVAQIVEWDVDRFCNHIQIRGLIYGYPLGLDHRAV